MDLASLFTPSADERIGLELECGLVDSDTGRSAGYDRARPFLESVLREFEAEPATEAGALVGVELPGGAQLSLELGGAVEYSSAPFHAVTDLVAATRREMPAIAALARGANLSLLPGGLVPFTPTASIPWAPKPRIDIMRRYFRGLGAPAAYAESVMGLTLSTQTTLDYLSAADFREKLTLLVKVAPVAAAMFVNSPLEDGRVTGVLSRRMQMWSQVDPARCGVLGFAVRPDASAGDVIDWALSLPMIYRYDGSGYIPGPARPFRELMADGASPTLADWRSHLSQMWPHVRPRHTLEMRAFDGVSWAALGAGPAFCAGLAYHGPSRRAALALLADVSAADLEQAWEDVAAKGLDALVGRRSVGATAEALLGLARQGLRARAEAGVEGRDAPCLLDPWTRWYAPA
ncbi:glutamate-cysteine ligase family protein [Phytohabitans rumicis]|uniref:Glutamate--cysteine ligase n=1 Tax=Phytohabitans rumicis TaxID=1076125 RepID=A0A6V8L503_9ACTN|nr:glutamate-cysteine ligase family protein [Phytohabitans rumicis]GFJ92342.1 glutamate--cysteine ligase [Phytohabitans rumicis]